MSYTLWQGDCLELLPTLTGINAVISDPPYGINYRQGGDPPSIRPTSDKAGQKWYKRHVDAPIHGDNMPFDPEPFLGFPVVVLFGANNFADRLPASRGWIFWDKKPDLGSNDFGDGELIWTNQSRVVRGFRHRWAGVIRDSENGEQSYHPTQKPITLMRWIIEQYTQPGDTVLDPYMGSGTTGVACIKTGRNFIGCEIDPGYFAIAQKRISEAAMQLPLLEVQP